MTFDEISSKQDALVKSHRRASRWWEVRRSGH